MTCLTSFAFHELVPALPKFATRYPKVDIELAITDCIADLLAENTDIGIRTGPISDPSLVARKIANVERGLFVSPDYLSRRGVPNRPEDLRQTVAENSTENFVEFERIHRTTTPDVTQMPCCSNSSKPRVRYNGGIGFAPFAKLKGHLSGAAVCEPLCSNLAFSELKSNGF